jgi:CRP/FNR family transcriptional regulator, cyclic AMP receptor protein
MISDWLVAMPVPERYDRKSWAKDSLMAMLSDGERAAILALGRPHQYLGEEVLFHQGDLSEFVVIVLDGYVKITAVSENGTEAVLAIRTTGDVVGELSAIDGLPRSATARAADVVLGRVIMKADLDRLLKTNFGIARAFNQAVNAKLREASRRQVEFRRDTKSRLAQVLVDLYHGPTGSRGDGSLAVPITQSELAGLVSGSEPAVHKALRALRDVGAIRTGHGHLIIADITQLRQIAANPANGALAPRSQLTPQKLGARQAHPVI